MEASSFKAFSGYDDIANDLPDVGSIDVDTSSAARPTSGPLSVTRASFFNLDHLFSKPMSNQPATSSTPIVYPVKDLFKATQSANQFSFNSHPAIIMAVNYMKSTIAYVWDGKSVRDLIFPGFDTNSAPSNLNVPALDEGKFREGAMGLLVKSFYNSCHEKQGNIEVERANALIQDINGHINSQATPLLIQFYRTLFSISPSEGMIQKYETLLLSRPYRTMKQHQAGQGTWQDANLEMFCHFAKLAACGASEDRIKSMYNYLTTTMPVLDGGTYADVQPDKWRNSRGWLSTGYLDWGDLGAHSLDSSFSRTYTGLGTVGYVKRYLVHDFLQDNHYWKSSSSSCFGGNTRVVISEAGDTRKICDIKPGDTVFSSTMVSIKSSESKRVAFVSAPHRQNRKLYSLKSYPGVQFTSTHPILLHSSTGSPYTDPTQCLTFVDKDRASSSNPSWQSFITENIDADLLQTHEARDDEGGLLFDLVFEPSASRQDKEYAPETYVVEADNGARLSVCSEAPIVEWFPFEIEFINHAIRQVTTHVSDIRPAFDLLSLNNFCTRNLLRDAAITANAAETSSMNMDSEGDAPSLLEACATSQYTADFVEKLMILLGRSLSHEIRNGWSRSAIASDSNPRYLVLFINVLRQLDGTWGNHPPRMGSEHDLKLWYGNSLQSEERIKGTVQGYSTLELYRPIVIGKETHSVSYDVTVQFTDTSSGLTWRGGGPLQNDMQAVLGLGTLVEDLGDHHAVAEVELRSVPKNMLQSASAWDEEKMAYFARKMGFLFGNQVVQQLKKQQMEGVRKMNNYYDTAH